MRLLLPIAWPTRPPVKSEVFVTLPVTVRFLIVAPEITGKGAMFHEPPEIVIFSV